MRSAIASNPRVKVLPRSPILDNCCYEFNPKGLRALFIVVSSEAEAAANGWEHASVSVMRDRESCPTWEEMEAAKRLIWGDDVACMQWHAREGDYFHGVMVDGKNLAPEVLHLWRPADGDWSKLTEAGPDADRTPPPLPFVVDKLAESVGAAFPSVATGGEADAVRFADLFGILRESEAEL